MAVYLWKLGYYDKKNPSASLIPTDKGYENLAKKVTELLPNDEHLIWGPELNVERVDGETEMNVISLKDKEDVDRLKEILEERAKSEE